MMPCPSLQTQWNLRQRKNTWIVRVSRCFAQNLCCKREWFPRHKMQHVFAIGLKRQSLSCQQSRRKKWAEFGAPEISTIKNHRCAWLPWLPDKSCLRQLTLPEVLIRYQTEPSRLCQFQGEESDGLTLQLCLQLDWTEIDTFSDSIDSGFFLFGFCSFSGITQRQPGPQFLSKQTCTGQSNPINNGWLAATRPATKADDKDLVASGDEIFGNERGGIHVVNQVHPPKQEWVTNGHNGFPAMHFINCYFCCWLQAFKATPHQRQNITSSKSQVLLAHISDLAGNNPFETVRTFYSILEHLVTNSSQSMFFKSQHFWTKSSTLCKKKMHVPNPCPP